ncbi:Mercuric reductase [Globisporangium polare]
MAHHHHHHSSGTPSPPLPSVRETTAEPYAYERDTTVMMGASFAGPSGLRLEPIKPASSASGASVGYHSQGSFEFGADGPMTRQRRSSQDEIRALLQRTTMALDKIVRIRESMEEFVDFKQFEKPPRRHSRTQSQEQQQQNNNNNTGRPTAMTRLSSGIILQEHNTRTTPASSYGSTVASSSSEDPLGRSTNSTHSSSSSINEEEEEDSTTDNTEDTLSGSSDSNTDGGHLQQAQQQQPQTPQVEEDEDDERESGNDTFDDGDDDSLSSIDSSISTADVSPLKEARLERLKSIEIAFHEGLPKEFFMAVCRFLYSTIEVKTRHSRFNFYKDSFTGSDAIKEMIVNGFAEDQPTAQRFGNVLVRLGFIEHVSRTADQLHNSKDNFYRFTKALEYDEGDYLATSGGGSPNSSEKSRMSITATNYRESVLSRESSGHVEYDFTTATDEVHALATEEVLQIFSRVLLKVFERKNKLLFYKGFVGCFLGAEAVNVIRELRIVSSLIDAVLLGQCLLDEGIIEPIATTVTTFQDKYVFYRLTKVRP